MMESTFQFFAEMPALYIHPQRCQEWLPDVPAGIATQLIGNKRFALRLSAAISAHYGLSPVAAADMAGNAIAFLDIEALSRLIHLSGAIFYGPYLRTEISGAAIASLLSGLDERAYEAAVKHADLSSGIDLETWRPAPITRDTILRDGHYCFRAWVKTLPPPVAKRVWLKFPNDPGDGELAPVFHTHGPKAVITAAKHIYQHVGR